MSRPTTVHGETTEDTREGEIHISDLHPFFSPKSVAVIGASPRNDNLGYHIVQSILSHGYQGAVVTVHPDRKEVSSCPVFGDVRELPDSVDLAVACVSAEKVAELVQPLAEKNIHHLIVISGGFAETGPEGHRLQKELSEAGKKFGVRIMGPNGMGTFSAPDNFNSFFTGACGLNLPKTGHAAIISQSGAFMLLMLDQLAARGIGVYRAANFGNRADVGESELLEELGNDPNVKVIGIYLESVKDGKRFVETANKISQTKPIIVYKGGHGKKGNRATLAHSASLAGSYPVFQAACAKANVVEVQGLGELIDSIHVLSLQPPTRGNRVLIVSNGGGMGVMLTDLCEKAGLQVPEPPEDIQKKLGSELPGYFSLKNPVDLTGSGTNEHCLCAVKNLVDSGQYDCLLTVLLSGTTGISPDIAEMFRSQLPEGFPVVAGVYGETMFPKMKSAFLKERIPLFSSGEQSAKALEILVRTGQRLNRSPADIATDHKSSLQPVAFADLCPIASWPPDEIHLKNYLNLCGVDVPSHFHIQSEEDVHTAIRRVGLPMVLKVVDKAIKHKTELKGIVLDIGDEETLLQEWRSVARSWPNRVWGEQQMRPGLDLMAGAYRDPQFGPVLLFGSGGSYVEIYQDIQRILLPASDREILDMVFNTRAGNIIKGTRGEPALDINSLADFLKLIAGWMIEEDEIESLDFNPVRLYKNGLVVLDAKLTPVI